MKKLLGILLAIAMLLTCTAMAEEAEAPALFQNDVVVLFTSDVHCGIESGWGYAGVDMVRNGLVKQGKTVLLVDCGDSIQGEPVGTMTTGSANIELMNAMKYDVATLGNHEFDYGMDRFFELKEMAEYPYVSCNFNKEGEVVLDPYVIKDIDGTKVAFVGISTPKTLTSSTPRYFMDDAGNYIYGFFQGENGEKLYNAVQTAVDAARAEGAQIVIAISHLGNEAECTPYTYADVLANTTGIDAMLDGHSHDTETVIMKNKDGEDVYRQGSGTKLANIGYLTISTTGEMATGLYAWAYEENAATLLGLDTEITKAVENATAELNKALSTVVAYTDVDLTIMDPANPDVRIIRNSETNLGDLCADAYRFVSGADIGFVNGGGVRVSIEKGDITMNDILKVHPFGNSLCVVETTGQEILDALEYSVHSWPGEFGGYLHVSGLTYEFHPYIESSVVTDTEGLFAGVEGEYRVKNVMVGGEPLDLEKTYTLACHDYKLKNMGDGYSMFADNVFLQDSVMLDNQVLITYITENLGGVVGSEYAEPYGQGRVIVVENAD